MIRFLPIYHTTYTCPDNIIVCGIIDFSEYLCTQNTDSGEAMGPLKYGPANYSPVDHIIIIAGLTFAGLCRVVLLVDRMTYTVYIIIYVCINMMLFNGGVL